MSTDLRVTENGTPLSRQAECVELAQPGFPVLGERRRSGEGGARVGERALESVSLRTQRRLLLAWMMLTDICAIFAAFGLAYWVRFDLQLTVAPEVIGPREMYIGLAVLLAALWVVVFLAFGLYDVQSRPGGTEESARVFNATTMAAMLVVVATFLWPTFIISRVWLISAWGLSFVLVGGSRLVTRRLVRAVRQRGYLLTPAVIVGLNEEAQSLATFLRDWRSSGVLAKGFVSTDVSRGDGRVGLPVLGTVTDISSIVRDHRIEDVIIAITSVSREELLQLCESVDTLPVTLRLSSGLYEMLTTRVSVRTLGTVPLMSLQKNRLDRREAAIKTALDISVALSSLLLLWPVMAAVAVAIKVDSRGPVLYRRRVLGAGGRQFAALKFRTMCVNGDEILGRRPLAAQELALNHKLKDDPRVTKVGRWLRKYSLDELPQLLNVLAGQMSLVGPRMITAPEAEKYGRHRLSLLSVKPGITGQWQVSGRSDVSYEERVRIDMYYVRTYSVWRDLQILFIETLPAVLRGRGAY